MTAPAKPPKSTKPAKVQTVRKTGVNATAFYFNEEDRRLLHFVTAQSGVSMSETVRRLVRAYAGGTPVPGLPAITKPDANARAWLKGR